MKAAILIKDLSDMTKKHIHEVTEFSKLSDNELQFKTDEKSWSILECIEHLNRYGNFYMPEIRRRMEASKHKFSSTFKSGVFGNYFAKSMLPKEKLNKMKTFKSMDPSHSNLDREVLDKFISQQHEILELLEMAKGIDLTKTKASISLSKWIKLRLGDVFRVVIYHNYRHLVQAKNVYQVINHKV